MTDIKPVATRQAFGVAVAALGEKYPNVVVCEADLSKSTKSELFAKKFPQRFFQMGIEEANMIGTAAGLALTGKIPFICSFGCFITGRFDQIRMSIAYTNVAVRIVGTHSGIGIGEDGYSQMALEDLACMRTLPGMLVLQPADDLETAAMVEELMQRQEPAYLRLTRQNLPRVHKETTKFKIGTFPVLKTGTKAAVLATGGVVCHALKAAENLEKQGIALEIVNASSIKPLDERYLAEAAKKFSTFITVEDHNILGGLGGAIAEWAASRGKLRVVRIGVEDEFGQSGSPEALYDAYGLSAAHLEKKFKAALVAGN